MLVTWTAHIYHRLSLLHAGVPSSAVFAPARGPSGQLWFLSAEGSKLTVVSRGTKFGSSVSFTPLPLPQGFHARLRLHPLEVSLGLRPLTTVPDLRLRKRHPTGGPRP